MRVPLSWLTDYVDLSVPVEDLALRLTFAGLEVAAIEQIGATWERDKLFVGEVLRVAAHPNADRLVLATVEYGAAEPMTVVTGAPNLFPYRDLPRPGLKVPFAIAGARLIDGHSADTQYVRLKPGKIRGVRSEGMVCSEKELGLSDEHEGILLLPGDAPVGTPLLDYLGDTVLEIELTPNLARAQSMLGVAREVAALTGTRLKREQILLQEIAGRVAPSDILNPPPAAEAFCNIVIEAPDLCPRYTAMLIRNVKIGPSPRWMQQRLRLAGQRPINNVVDITNYVMLEWGQPLHAFDYDALCARVQGTGVRPTIIVRRAHEGERLTTLDGVSRGLTQDMLMIADTAGSIALAGVMGGEETEISAATTSILLESACFNNINNRRTSQTLKLASEAAARFGKGIPATLAPLAARRAAQWMADLAGGEVVPGVIDAYPVPQPDVRVALRSTEVSRLLGIEVAAEEVVRHLEALEFAVQPRHVDTAGATLFDVTVPWHRLDVEIAADLVEEVARLVGYEQIPTTLLASELPPQRHNWVLLAEETLRTVLVGCGLQDTVNYPLISAEDNARLLAAADGGGWTEPAATPDYQIPALLRPADSIRLANPMNVERSVMRTSMLPSALQSLAGNLRYAERLATFEIGRVYWPQAGQELPREARHVSLVLTGARAQATWLSDDAPAELDFFDLKGIVETMLARAGIEPDTVRFVQTVHPAFTRRAARVLVGGRDIGILGELHPAVRTAFDLPARRVVCAELSLTPVIEVAPHDVAVRPLPRFPAVKEDLAVVVDEHVAAAAVADLIRVAAGPLLSDLRLFDVYRGDPIAAGQKSLAFSVTYQHSERSLTDADAARVREAIVASLARELGAHLRS